MGKKKEKKGKQGISDFRKGLEQWGFDEQYARAKLSIDESLARAEFGWDRQTEAGIFDVERDIAGSIWNIKMTEIKKKKDSKK